MHLSKLPTVFTKDGVERKAYHTVEARELISFGWVEAGIELPIVQEATEAIELKEEVQEKVKVVRTKPLTVKVAETGANK